MRNVPGLDSRILRNSASHALRKDVTRPRGSIRPIAQ